MNLNLNNKKILITGSSKGIGLQIAKEFIMHSSKVCINSRNFVDLSTMIKNDKFENLYHLKFDLKNKNNIKKLAKKAYEKMGGIDILVCNLGDGETRKNIGEETYDDWLDSIKTNLLSATDLIFHTKKYLKKSPSPSIVCISSIASLISIQAPLDYSASKAALNLYVKNQSKILSKYNIRINVITPGNIYAEDGRWPLKFKKNNKLKKQIIKDIPLGRFGTPQDIAYATLFLSSDISSFTTGSNLVIDGGQTS